MKQTVVNQVKQLNDRVYTITEAESIHCYLIVGSQKAVLFDVGYGYENIIPIVESITELPIQIVISHGDPDHALGARHYKEVYVHPLDLGKTLMNNTNEMKRKSLDYRKAKLPYIEGTFDEKTFFDKTFGNTEFKFLIDGDCIDLGDLKLKVIHAPGHSYGHIFLHEVDRGWLFTGDALTSHNVWYFMSTDANASFYQARSTYRKLWKVRDTIKDIFPAHGQTPLGIDLLAEYLEVFEHELANNYKDDTPFDSFAGNGYQHLYKRVNLIYSDERLSEFIEKEIDR